MEYLESIFFLMIIVVYISALKANTLFIVFGATIYIFILMQLLNLEPLEILSDFIHNLAMNPFGFLLLLFPFITNGIYRGFRKLLIHKGSID